MKKVVKIYLSIKGTNVYRVAKDNGINRSNLQYPAENDWELVATRVYKMIANTLKLSVVEVFAEIAELNECLEDLKNAKHYKTIIDCNKDDYKGHLEVLRDAFEDWLENRDEYKEEDISFVDRYESYVENEDSFKSSEEDF